MADNSLHSLPEGIAVCRCDKWTREATLTEDSWSLGLSTASLGDGLRTVIQEISHGTKHGQPRGFAPPPAFQTAAGAAICQHHTYCLQSGPSSHTEGCLAHHSSGHGFTSTARLPGAVHRVRKCDSANALSALSPQCNSKKYFLAPFWDHTLVTDTPRCRSTVEEFAVHHL
eukprot:scaffold11546_cov21-Tisochrysis_lutea.AAC.2